MDATRAVFMAEDIVALEDIVAVGGEPGVVVGDKKGVEWNVVFV